MSRKSRGFFITFEGGEGSGKSTQVEILANRLSQTGYEVVVTREPGGTKIGEKIREITHDPQNTNLEAKTEAYLMAAARAQHVSQVIIPALKSGKIVICDRFLDSSLAYQGYGRLLGEKVIFDLNKLAVSGITPDLTILLDIDVNSGLKRRKISRKKIDRLDLQQKDFYSRVNRGYKQLAQKYSKRFFVVSSKKPIETVAKIIWERVKKIVNSNA